MRAVTVCQMAHTKICWNENQRSDPHEKTHFWFLFCILNFKFHTDEQTKLNWKSVLINVSNCNANASGFVHRDWCHIRIVWSVLWLCIRIQSYKITFAIESTILFTHTHRYVPQFLFMQGADVYPFLSHKIHTNIALMVCVYACIRCKVVVSRFFDVSARKNIKFRPVFLQLNACTCNL